MTELDKKIADTKQLLIELEKQKTALTSEENDLRILEFYKRGYCAGTTIKSFDYGHLGYTYTFRESFPRIVNRNQIWYDGHVIYRDGRWAEIIEQPKLKVENFTVEARGGKAFINGHYYGLEELETISAFMKSHSSQVKFISCGCSENNLINIPVKTIDDILSLIKSQNILEENRKKVFIPETIALVKYITNHTWWYAYKEGYTYPVRQATSSDFIDVEIGAASRNPEDYWAVSGKVNSGYLILKSDCRILNISEK